MATRIASLRGILDLIGAEPVNLDRQIQFDEILIRPRVELAQNASDTAVNFGEITTASVVYIETDVEITYKLNGSSNTSYAILTGGCLLVMGGSITAIHLSEANVSAAVLKIILCGT